LVGKSFHTKASKLELNDLKKKLSEFCEKHYKSEFSLHLKTPKIKEREKKVNCKTFHGAGIFVPTNAQ